MIICLSLFFFFWKIRWRWVDVGRGEGGGGSRGSEGVWRKERAMFVNFREWVIIVLRWNFSNSGARHDEASVVGSEGRNLWILAAVGLSMIVCRVLHWFVDHCRLSIVLRIIQINARFTQLLEASTSTSMLPGRCPACAPTPCAHTPTTRFTAISSWPYSSLFLFLRRRRRAGEGEVKRGRRRHR